MVQAEDLNHEEGQRRLPGEVHLLVKLPTGAGQHLHHPIT